MTAPFIGPMPLCGCGCKESISAQANHRKHPAKFIWGHGRSAKVNVWLIQNNNKHFCACGCGEFIKLRRKHFYAGIPRYIYGHQITHARAKFKLGFATIIKSHPHRIKRGTAFDFWTKVKALQRANFKCQQCTSSILEQLEFDHILAIGLGGQSTLENAQILCVACHRVKSIEDTSKIRKLVYNVGKSVHDVAISN